jgi:hypothetical protein
VTANASKAGMNNFTSISRSVTCLIVT